MFIPGKPHWLRARLGLLPTLVLLGCFACIDRSNPFDPINAGARAVSDIRAANQPRLDSLTAGENAFTTFLTGVANLFNADSLENDGRRKANSAKRTANAERALSNDSVEAANQAALPEFLVLKQTMVPLDTLKEYGPYPDFRTRRDGLRFQAATLQGFLSRINAENSPAVPYPKSFSDSVFAPFARDTLAFFLLQIRMDGGNTAVKDSNAAIVDYNALRARENVVVGVYNDSIVFVRENRNRNIITQPDSLQGITFAAKPGDSIVIGPGVFPVDLRFTNSGTLDSPIVVRGYPGMRTILAPVPDQGGVVSSSTLILSGRSHIRFEDLVFRGGTISGVKVENGSVNVAFRRCTFDSSGQFGLEMVDSDVDLLDCRLLANGTGARLQGSIRMRNVLIARNTGQGLETVSLQGEIINCTMADNGGDGIRVKSPRRSLSIANSIISSNGGYGIFREPEYEYQEEFRVEQSDVWGHAEELDWGLGGMDSTRASDLKRANLNIAPEFIDAPGFNYGLMPGSKLAGYETQALPVIIGWRP